MKLNSVTTTLKRAGAACPSILRGMAPYAIPLVAMLLTIDHSIAGTTATDSNSAYGTGGLDASASKEFDQAGKKGDAWLRNSFGKTIAIFSSISGLVAAGFTKSFTPAAWGVGIATAAVIVPPVIGGFFSATI